MEKKIYTIHGFDCANCAAKTERFLASQSDILEVVLDFAGDKLYITYKNKAWPIETLRSKIKEIESDKILIKDVDDTTTDDKSNNFIVILMSRILFAVLVIILSFTVFKDTKYYWVNFGLYLTSIFVITYDIFYKVIKNIIHKQNPIDEYLLISISCVGAFVLASIEKSSPAFMESTMVVCLFQIGKIIEGIAVNKSKKAISKASDLRSLQAHLIKGDDIENVKPETLQINDLVVVNENELIPIDGKIVSGECLVDTSSLTGEFVPLRKQKDEVVLSGCTLKQGSVVISVLDVYQNSTVARLIDLISNSGERKSKADKFVTKFARYYTPIVFLIGVLVAVIGGLVTSNWHQFILLGLKLLIISCPCAIVISVPLAYFSAIGLGSKNGILIKGGNYLDQLNNLKKVIVDKTGTLTKGVFKIKEVFSVANDAENFMKNITIAEAMSQHPIALTIKNGKKVNVLVNNFHDLPGLGIECTYQDKKYVVGNSKLMYLNSITFNEIDKSGIIVYMAIDGVYQGYIILDDEIKQEANSMVSLFSIKRIETIIFSGDNEKNVRNLAESLNVKKYKYSLSPEDKSEALELEKSNKYSVAFVGDGVNDAACIKSSDVGFAMGGIGSDIAVSNADIVIMNDNPKKVYDCYKIAKMARRTAVFNIVAALTIKLSIEIAAIITSSLGYQNAIPMWAAVLADTGLTVILIINSLLLLYRKV